MKNPYKLLVVDIDGTILNKQGAISVEDREAIALVTAAGVKVALSTGRVVQASRWILDELNLTGYHIFFDGALVCNPDNGHEVYAEPLEKNLVKESAIFARKNDLNLDFFSSTHYFVEDENWTVDIRRKFFRLEPTLVKFSELWQKERIIKGTVIVRTDEERARAAALQEHFRGRLIFSWTTTPAYTGVNFINVVSPLISKGKALEKLCGLLGISQSDVVAIGDGVNDVSLLKQAGLAVAMGNCADELKAVAHVVTHDVEHSGVAEAIKKYLVP
jgi:Cof subfamily protein (haloacid dehalogenase superfamily)